MSVSGFLTDPTFFSFSQNQNVMPDTLNILNKEYNMNTMKTIFDHVTKFLEQNKTVQKRHA